MDQLNITVNEYQDKVILGVDRAISPLKTIRDLTKVLAENGMPVLLDDADSLYRTLDTAIRQIQDIVFII